MNNSRQERVETVNKIIKKIGTIGRRFFYHKPDNFYGYFKLINNRVYFVDDYTKHTMYAYGYKNFSKGFSHGGTLQALVLDFSEFIRTGKCTNGNNGYGGLYCTHWGYSEEDMKGIRDYAEELGYLEGADE